MSPRRKRGRAISGWVALDKPVGRTSTHALAQVKRIFDAQKAGHAGTLDPLASGCLPIALGEATKTVPYVVDGRKVYRFTVRWGVETNTDDSEGVAVSTSEHRPTAEEIRGAIGAFVGTIMQTPPAFSAVKLDGARAYDLAREGDEVVLEPRQVTVYRLSLVDVPDRDHAVLEAECGKGTYVRAIARDLGRRLDCFGHVSALRRLSVGHFGEPDLVTMEALQAALEASGPDGPLAFIHPVEAALDDLPELCVGGGDRQRLLAGQTIILRGRDAPAFAGPAFATAAGRLVAVGDVAAGEFAPRRVFHL